MTDSAADAAATAATPASSPQTTIVSASTGRVWSASAASVRRRWMCGGCAPIGAHDEDGVDSGGHDVVSLGAVLRPRPGARAAARGIGRRASAACGCPRGSAGASLELAALAFAEAAPDPEALVVLQRVLEAFAANVARRADASSRRASSRPSQGRTPPDLSARTAHRSATPSGLPSSPSRGRRTPGTPSWTGSTNQLSGTPERYCDPSSRSPTF